MKLQAKITTSLTLLYRIDSSQFVLTNGTIPKRWAIYSSGRTVVFMKISTISIAAVYSVNCTKHKPLFTYQLLVCLP